jgi:GNAT superfamily N-acetyltransferase
VRSQRYGLVHRAGLDLPMAGEFVVRDANFDDAAGIARVHVGTWQHAYRGQIPDDYLDGLDVEQRRLAWKRLLDGKDPEWLGPVWVAETEGSIVGFASCGTNHDDAGDRVGELFAIYALPEHWDTGAGRALFETAVEWLRANYDEATLWVLDANVRARRFYEIAGWAPDGTTKADDRGSFVLRETRYRVRLR